MVSFCSLIRIAVLCVGFRLGTLHGYFFTKTFNFPLKNQIKLVLSVIAPEDIKYCVLVVKRFLESMSND